MKKEILPVVGDVIMSKRFINGKKDYDPENPIIHVGSDQPRHMVDRAMTDGEIAAFVLEHGKMPKSTRVVEDYASIDVSRGFAEYVVIEAKMQGGGSTGYPHDDYPDGWHIVAKRLDKSGNWDDQGEVIEFYMTGCFIDMIPPEEVRIVRTMRQAFI